MNYVDIYLYSFVALFILLYCSFLTIILVVFVSQSGSNSRITRR